MQIAAPRLKQELELVLPLRLALRVRGYKWGEEKGRREGGRAFCQLIGQLLPLSQLLLLLLELLLPQFLRRVCSNYEGIMLNPQSLLHGHAGTR